MNSPLFAENPRLRRIVKVSRLFRRLCLLLLILGAVFGVAIWFLPIVGDEVRADWNRHSVPSAVSEELPERPPTLGENPAIANGTPENEEGSNNVQTIGWRVGVGHQLPPGEERIRPEFVWSVRPLGFLSIVFGLAGAWVLHRLFGLYERGMIFHRETVRCIRWIGIWLLAKWTLANLWELTEVFTHNPSFSDLRIDGYLFGGLLVFLISWIMEEGSKLQEEQEMTI